jgi:hypothetical protein
VFRFSIRELLLVTLIVAMGTAWGIDHRALATARHDAEALARFGQPFSGACGQTAGFWLDIAEKYTDRKSVRPKVFILDEVEDLLGVTAAAP